MIKNISNKYNNILYTNMKKPSLRENGNTIEALLAMFFDKCFSNLLYFPLESRSVLY